MESLASFAAHMVMSVLIFPSAPNLDGREMEESGEASNNGGFWGLDVESKALKSSVQHDFC